MSNPVEVETWLAHDFRTLALKQVEQATKRFAAKVEVPDSAVGHIIGKSHRTINALRLIPGITHVSVHEDVEDEDMQRVEIQGSTDAVSIVLAQIKRLQMRSYAASVQPEMQYCYFSVGSTRFSQADDPLILRIASADKLRIYLPQHLRIFLYRNFPENFDERTYYYFHSRSCGEAAAKSFLVPKLILTTDQTPSIKPSIRRKTFEKLRACQVFGSCERTLYCQHIASSLCKLLKEQCDAGGVDRLKIRLLIGKALFYGSDLSEGDLWKLSVEHMDEKMLFQRLRPFFGMYTTSSNVRNARRFLQTSGYHQVNFNRTISIQLVDMDADVDSKESYHLRLRKEFKNDAQARLLMFHKVAKKRAFFTFLNDHRGVDLEMRIQTRQSIAQMDEATGEALVKAWLELSGIEQPLILPSGKRFFPLNSLHKDVETYRNSEGFEIAITEVRASDENKNYDNSSSGWKLSMRNPEMEGLLNKAVVGSEIENHVEEILARLYLSIDESFRLSQYMAEKNLGETVRV